MYCLTHEQFEKLSKVKMVYDFRNAEMLVATFRTDHEIVSRILPRPLSPSKTALATAFVAKYPETNFGCIYNEGALFIHCQYKGEQGLYCLSMPVDDDMALIGGREQFGYPKKIADKITLQQEANQVVGSVRRKGTEILRIEARLEGDVEDNFMDQLAVPTKDWEDVPCYKVISFLFKYFPSPSGGAFDYLPRLIREPILFRNQGPILKGSGRVIMTSTAWDPLGDIPIGESVTMFYGKWNNTMLPGRVAARIWNPLKFAKHAFFKTDFASTFIDNYDSNRSKRDREIFKIAKTY